MKPSARAVLSFWLSFSLVSCTSSPGTNGNNTTGGKAASGGVSGSVAGGGTTSSGGITSSSGTSSSGITSSGGASAAAGSGAGGQSSRGGSSAANPDAATGNLDGPTTSVPNDAAGGANTPASAWKNVQIVGGGFVPGIIFNKKQKDLVYARTDMGEAYRLDATTQRWVPLLDWIGPDDWNLTGVESLATDPVDPTRLYIAAGTYTNSWASQNGAILRSTDQGATFQRTDLPFKLGGNMPGRSMGERLAIDPNQNSILFFGARSGNGLWKSTDFGVTWNKVSSFTAVGSYAPLATDSTGYQADPIGVAWVTFDARSGSSGSASQTIYVGVADQTTSVYRSTDGGATWSALAGQPSSGYFPHHGVLASTGMLYLSYSDTVGPYDGAKGDVWKYDTAKSTWTLISPIASTTKDDYFGYGGLGVDAQHPDTLMVAALNSWWPDTIIFRSTDAGATWTRIWDWNGYPTRSFRYTLDISAAPWLVGTVIPAPPELNPKLGWMVGSLEIDPFNSDRMLYGTGATLFGTDNLTAWDAGGQIKLTVKAAGIEETSVLDLVCPPTGAPLLSAMGDIAGFYHKDVTQVPAKEFATPSFTTTTSIDFAENTPGFVVRVGNLASGSTDKAIGLSYDGGQNWFMPSNQPSPAGGGQVAVGADTNAIVWSVKDGVVNVTLDKGSTWAAAKNLPPNANLAADRVNAKKFYAFASGKFYVSSDSGVTFTASAATGLPAGSAKIKAMPGHEGDIWVAGGSTGAAYGLWHSTDSGATFTLLSNVQEADVIGFGKAAPGQSYMALYTSAKINDVRGIFRSDDAGATWLGINDDQHQFAITGIAMTGDRNNYGRVYVATNGRGILYRDL